MAVLGKILFQVAKSIALSKLRKKDENGGSIVFIVIGIVVGIIFLLAAFLQYVVESPIETLRAYFSDEKIKVVEQFRKSELGTTVDDFNMSAGFIDESMLPSFNTDSEAADRLIREAYKHLGKPYVWAAFGPDRFDCSGYVAYCLRNSGVQKVPSRPTCRSLWADDVIRIKKGEEKAGDLIFFAGTQPMVGATHIGIYLGGNLFIEANSDYGVKVSKTDTSWVINHFYGYGRPKALAKEQKTERSEQGGQIQEEGTGKVIDKKESPLGKKDKKKRNKTGGNKRKKGKSKGTG